MKLLISAIKYLFYIFIFVLPWQTKIVLSAAETNYNEISLYVSYALLLVIIALFFVYKFKIKIVNSGICCLWYLLAGLELVILISTFFSVDKVLAWYYYVSLLIGIALFYLVRHKTKFIDYKHLVIDKTKIIYIFLFSIFIHSILGIYEFLIQKSFSFKYLGLASHSPETLGSSVIETISGRWLRAYGGFDHPNIFGGVLAIALLLAVYLLLKKKIINSRQQKVESLFLFLFYFISLFSLFFTFSRASWLAFLSGIIVLIITFLRSKDRAVLKRLLILLIFSGVLLGTAVVPYSELVKTRIQATGRLERQSIEKRTEYLNDARSLVKNNFFVGIGIGNYVKEIAEINENKNPEWYYQPVHNTFILLTTESGIFSLLFFLAFLFYLIKKNRQEEFSTAIFVALIVLMLFDHWLLSLPFGILFLFFVLGLI